MLKFKNKNESYLDCAIQNLNETIERGHVACTALDLQGETIYNINKGFNKVNKKLDFSERIISDMKSPFIKPLNVRSAEGQNELKTEFFEGYVYKRGRKLKIWNKRYFILDVIGNMIRYKYRKSDPTVAGTINLNGAKVGEVKKGERDYNGVICNKNNAFEIIEDDAKFGDTIYLPNSEAYIQWKSYIEPSKEKENKEPEKIDIVLDMLDQIHQISHRINGKVENQIDNLKSISKQADKTDIRLQRSISKVKHL
jgi:hypothetical protein